MSRRYLSHVPRWLAGACLVAAFASPCSAELTRPGAWGIGLTAGYQMPIAQEDVEAGPAFGVRGRWGLLRFLELEPMAVLLANTSASTRSGLEVTAGHVTSVGCNALFKTGGRGLGAYAALGLGWSLRDLPAAAGNQGDITFEVGLGAEKQFGPVRLDLSPRLFVLRGDAGSTRKHLALQLGVTRYF